LNRTRPIGIVLAFTGMLASILGFAFWYEGAYSCASVIGTNVVCTEPRAAAILPFYLATAGSSLLSLGIWRTGLGKHRIVVEGRRLVTSIGLITLASGLYLCALLPYPSTTAAGLGYFFGLLGGALLMGGLVKMNAIPRVGVLNPS
jgi:hypothetical protein